MHTVLPFFAFVLLLHVSLSLSLSLSSIYCRKTETP